MPFAQAQLRVGGEAHLQAEERSRLPGGEGRDRRTGSARPGRHHRRRDGFCRGERPRLRHHRRRRRDIGHPASAPVLDPLRALWNGHAGGLRVQLQANDPNGDNVPMTCSVSVP